MPDPKADIGQHQLIYSFFPHANDYIHSDVLAEAAQVNQLPAVFPGYDGKGVNSFFHIDSDDVVLEVIKKAEKEEAFILRLFEPYGKRARVDLNIQLREKRVQDLHRTLKTIWHWKLLPGL